MDIHKSAASFCSFRPLILLLLIPWAPAQNTDRVFPSWSTDSDQIPITTVAADFNGDGIQDFALGKNGSRLAEVFVSTGDGDFQSSTDFPMPGWAVDLAGEDLNGDGMADLLVLNANPYSLVTYIGDGSGGFGPAMTLSLGYSASSISVADLDGDGVLDLAIGDRTGDSLQLLQGAGDGTFINPTAIPVARRYRDLAAKDINGDGIVDVVAVDNQFMALDVYLGLGGGALGAVTSSPLSEEPYYFALGDMDQDGNLDVVTGCLAVDKVAVSLGAGDGTFGPASYLDSPGIPLSLTVSDLDSDGLLDIATVNRDTDLALLYFGQGNGMFAAPRPVPAPEQPVSISSGDFDGSGNSGIVMTGVQRDLVFLHHGVATAEAWPFAVDIGSSLGEVAIGDMDGDGLMDVVVAEPGADQVGVLLGDGAGGLGSPLHLPAMSQSGTPDDLTLADFNGDGRLDIVVAHSAFGGAGPFNLGLHLQLPGGAYAPVDLIPDVDNARDVQSADLNQDGSMDLLAANRITNDVTVLLGNGDGTFSAMPRVSTGGIPVDIAVEDYNGDGVPDFAVARSSPASIRVFLGGGDGTFAATPGSWPTGGEGVSCAAGDLDMDGIPDLVGQGAATSVLRVALGAGDGTFVAASPITLTSAGNGNIYILDINGDCLSDVVLCHYDQLQVALGLGDGAFAPTQAYASGARSNYSAVGDMDGDGFSDLVYASRFSNYVAVTRNVTTGPQCVGENYCGFSINSTGDAARIFAIGERSVMAEDLQLNARNVPAGQFGFFFFAMDRAQAPLGDGFLCTGGGIVRLPVEVSNAAGELQHDLDYTLSVVANNLVAGSTWNFQAWYRDPQSTGSGSNLTDGLTIEFLP